MKIYKYYGGKIHELEVRETAKRYISDNYGGAAFNFCRIFEKTEPTTPEQAILEEKNKLLTSKGMYEDRLRTVNAEINKLEAFEMEINYDT